jgi:hypothetical protein
MLDSYVMAQVSAEIWWWKFELLHWNLHDDQWTMKAVCWRRVRETELDIVQFWSCDSALYTAVSNVYCCLSVCLSDSKYHCGSHRTDRREIWIKGFYENLSKKSKTDENGGPIVFHCDWQHSIDIKSYLGMLGCLILSIPKCLDNYTVVQLPSNTTSLFYKYTVI